MNDREGVTRGLSKDDRVSQGGNFWKPKFRVESRIGRHTVSFQRIGETQSPSGRRFSFPTTVVEEES